MLIIHHPAVNVTMKSFILASLLVVAVSASLLEEHGAKFQAFKLEHGKTYKNQAEEAKRFAIFRDTLREIEEHNALYELGLVSYKKGINKFSDMTKEEFRSFLNLHPKPAINGTPYVKTGVAIPDSVDWREQGQVTDVKDQGECSSCWAFSVVGSTEAAYFRKTGNLVPLSAQQLVDCSRSINNGCRGGYLADSFVYIGKKGLQSESSYPYNARDNACAYNESEVVTNVSNYVTIEGDESATLEAVATVGPVSVSLDASYLSTYSSGIYSDEWCVSVKLNHGVLIVGYGSENGQDYWIVKNSWGASWGENGYFRILRGTNACGIDEDDVYPVL